MSRVLRADITDEEYQRIRVEALQSGRSTQAHVALLLRKALGIETERGKSTRLDVPVVALDESDEPGLAPPGRSPRSASSLDAVLEKLPVTTAAQVKPKRQRTSECEHRLRPDQFCKQCDG